MALHDRIQAVTDWLKRVITQPRGELTRWQSAVRFGYDLGRYGAKQLKEDRASEMAAALAFRTLFALFPVMVVASAVFQGFYGREPFRDLVRNLIEGLGLSDVPVVPLDTTGSGRGAAEGTSDGAADGAAEGVEAGATGDEAQQELGAWLEEFIFQITDFDMTTLGWMGFVIVLYASVAMMVTIEETFNTVCRAPEGRSWIRRFPMYWTVLSIGAVVIWLILLVDERFGEWVGEAALLDWARVFARAGWTFLIIWLMLFSVYTLVPNTSVAYRAAMAGAFVAAIGVLIGKELLARYIATFVSIRQLYGAIGFVPLLMFWMYVMWLVVLFGLEVASTLQTLGGRRNMDEMEAKRQQRGQGLIDPASILVVMESIAHHFMQGKPTSAKQISDETSIPPLAVSDMLDRLVQAELVHVVEKEGLWEGGHTVTLAMPPEKISSDRMIEVGYAMAEEVSPSRRSELVQRLRQAERDIVAGSTLASLLDRGDLRPALRGNAPDVQQDGGKSR